MGKSRDDGAKANADREKRAEPARRNLKRRDLG